MMDPDKKTTTTTKATRTAGTCSSSAVEKEAAHQDLASPTFRPNLDGSFAHHRHGAGKIDGGAPKSVSERLYDDAKHRMEEQRSKDKTAKPSGAETTSKNKTPPPSMSSPFRPDLTDAFSHRGPRPSERDGTAAAAAGSVSDRLYEDAVHRQREVVAGVVDGHCRRHELERGRVVATPGGDEDHVHVRAGGIPREHPLATDLCPKADYLRRMDSSMSVDGGSIEGGECV